MTPSKVWPRSAEEKAAIITKYKERLGSIDCKYWSRSLEGEKSCPFGTSCFYRHQGAEASCLLTIKAFLPMNNSGVHIRRCCTLDCKHVHVSKPEHQAQFVTAHIKPTRSFGEGIGWEGFQD